MQTLTRDKKGRFVNRQKAEIAEWQEMVSNPTERLAEVFKVPVEDKTATKVHYYPNRLYFALLCLLAAIIGAKLGGLQF